MSEESRSNEDVQLRLLCPAERALVRAMLGVRFGGGDLEQILASSCVEDMRDGGMGSVRFAGPSGVPTGKALAEATYVDEDGITVSIVINVDDQGNLCEIDFWKVDFSPLRRYPLPSQLSVIL